MKQIILVLLAVSTLSCKAQNYTLSDFTLDSLPIGKKLYETYKSKQYWTIKSINDSIIIKEYDDNYSKRDTLPFSEKQIKRKIKSSTVINKSSIRDFMKVDDGYIIGLNDGEFGGGLWFLSLNGRKSYEITPYIRVKDIFEFNNKLYVIRGLSHITVSYGSLLEIKKNKKWKVHKAYQLQDAPKFVVFEKENILILTSEYLMSFNKLEVLTKVLHAPFYWGTLSPSSAIIIGNDIYIALKKGVLGISYFKTRPEYSWYIMR